MNLFQSRKERIDRAGADAERQFRAYSEEISYDSEEYSEKEEVIGSHGRDMLIGLGIFIAVTVVSFFFLRYSSDPTLNIAMLYTLGLIIITRYTQGYLVGLIFTLASVLSVNFFFTYPYSDFNFVIEGYQVAFLGMLVIGIITSAMSSNMNKQSRKLIQQEKEIANQRVELIEAQKEKMRANLLRAVSHDLRTPLTGIIGSTSLILDNNEKMNSDEKLELVQNIGNDANWLLNMVENLLSVTRIGNTGENGTNVNKTLESVDEVVSAALMQFRKRFPDASVKVNLPEDVVLLEMDAILIQQVIINILQNAELHARSEKPLELTVEDRRGEVAFHIRDYGIGIDPARLDTIFDGESFADDGRTDGYKGMGIGLSICKTIVLAHGGRIVAINRDEGAEFCFTLPKED